MVYRIFLIAAATILFSSCNVSLKGITIAPTISTFYVDVFQNRAFNAPPDIGIQFTESFKELVLNSTRLNYDEFNPDIEISGSVRTFNVTSVAPEQQEDGGVGSALNRLSISVEVEYFNNQNEEDTWKQNFSFFQDFESTESLENVQDDLIVTIFDQINQDIFNKTFTNW